MATEGPWEHIYENRGFLQEGDVVGSEGCKIFIPCAVGNILNAYECVNAANRNSIFMAHARTDVPELARRLKRAIETIRDIERFYPGLCVGRNLEVVADELESMPGEK